MRERPSEFLNPTFDEVERTYINSPTFRGFPLGGIGTGGVSIYGDGGFSEARTNHNWFTPVRDLRGSFFAVRTKEKASPPRAMLLRRTHHDSVEFDVDNVSHTTFKGEVPGFRLEFTDDVLPVKCSLTGFSPMIPQNIKDSSLPAVMFNLIVENDTDEAIELSALFSWQNTLGITGTGGSAMIAEHTFACDFSENNFAVNPDLGINGVKFVVDKDFDAKDTRRRSVGSSLIFVDEGKDLDVSTCLSWDQRTDVPSFWEDFKNKGRIFTSVDYDPKVSDKYINGKAGAVSVATALNPNETKTISFYLCWYNPHYVLEKGAPEKIESGKHDGIDHGIYAANFFESVEEVGLYVRDENIRLLEETNLLESILKDDAITDLPDWIKDVILNSRDSMIVNSVLTKKGEFFVIEGMDWQMDDGWPFGGLTGTNDQRLSSHPFSSVFFSALDKSELVTFRDLAMEDFGKVPHGNGGAEIALKDTDTPYSKPIPWLNNNQNDWPDLTCSLILQLGKLVKITGDLDLLNESWLPLISMNDYLLNLVEDNVPEGSSTYDIFAYEPCFLYHATLFVAASRMLADLAVYIPEDIDPDAKERIRGFNQAAGAAYKTFNEKLWREDEGYFRINVGNDNLFQGGLAGDWISRYTGMPTVVDAGRARSHTKKQDVLLVEASMNCKDPKTTFGALPLPFNEADLNGNEIPLNFFDTETRYCYNYIYQTVSYQAMESIYLGNVEEGLKCIKMIYDKVYREGYPWDMNLLGLPGYVYMTHPVMWAFFNAMTGAALDLLDGTLYLAPKTLSGRDELRLPVFFPHFWLSVKYNAETGTGEVKVIKVMDGVKLGKASASFKDGGIFLKRLVLTNDDDTLREVSLDDFEVRQGNSFRFSMVD